MHGGASRKSPKDAPRGMQNLLGQLLQTLTLVRMRKNTNPKITTYQPGLPTWKSLFTGMLGQLSCRSGNGWRLDVGGALGWLCFSTGIHAGLAVNSGILTLSGCLCFISCCGWTCAWPMIDWFSAVWCNEVCRETLTPGGARSSTRSLSHWWEQRRFHVKWYSHCS